LSGKTLGVEGVATQAGNTWGLNLLGKDNRDIGLEAAVDEFADVGDDVPCGGNLKSEDPHESTLHVDDEQRSSASAAAMEFVDVILLGGEYVFEEGHTIRIGLRRLRYPLQRLLGRYPLRLLFRLLHWLLRAAF